MLDARRCNQEREKRKSRFRYASLFFRSSNAVDSLDSFEFEYRESIEDTLGKAYEKILGNVHAYALLEERSGTLACLRASHSTRCSTRDLFKVEINLPNAQIRANRRWLLSRAPIPGAVVAASSMRADNRRPRKRLTAITRAYNARAFAAAAAAVTRAKPASLSLRVASREPRRQGVTQFAQTSRELRGRELCAIACS